MISAFQPSLSIRQNTDGTEHQTEAEKKDTYIIWGGHNGFLMLVTLVQTLN